MAQRHYGLANPSGEDLYSVVVPLIDVAGMLPHDETDRVAHTLLLQQPDLSVPRGSQTARRRALQASTGGRPRQHPEQGLSATHVTLEPMAWYAAEIKNRHGPPYSASSTCLAVVGCGIVGAGRTRRFPPW